MSESAAQGGLLVEAPASNADTKRGDSAYGRMLVPNQYIDGDSEHFVHHSYHGVRGR